MGTLVFLNIGTSELIIVLVLTLISIVPLLLAIAALLDGFRRDFGGKTTDKVLMVILIILAPFIGSLLYLLSLRKNYPLKKTLYV